MTEQNQTTPSPETPPPKSPPRKSGREYWIKIGFVVIALIAIATVYMWQRRALQIKGWDKNLDEALKQAGTKNRKVLAFFVSCPPSATARNMAKTILAKPENLKAIEDGRFIRVIVDVKSTKSELAKRYKVTQLPTMIILSPAGEELNRRVGNIGEVPFRNDFLNCQKIIKP